MIYYIIYCALLLECCNPFIRNRSYVELFLSNRNFYQFSTETEVAEDVTHNMLFKVILIGESGVGKTNLFTRFMRNEFKSDTTATIGIEFAIKNYEVKDKIIKVQLWDTGKFLYW